jgi:hypothetical protein
MRLIMPGQDAPAYPRRSEWRVSLPEIALSVFV